MSEPHLPPIRPVPRPPGRFRRRGAPGPARPAMPIQRADLPPPVPPGEPSYAYAPTAERPRPAVVLDGLRRARYGVLVATVFLVPVAFWRATFDRFNLTKITIIWVAAILCLGLGLAEGVLGGWRARYASALRLPFPMVISAGVLLAGALIATGFSVNRTTSLIGRYHRYNGLLGLVALLVIGFFIAIDVRRHAQMKTVLGAHLAGTLLGVAYAVAQWAGSTSCGPGCFRDPAPLRGFVWQSSQPVFGSWGNPDFLAGAAAIGVFSALGLALATRQPHLRVAFLVGALGCAFGVFVSRADQGWLALAVGALGVALIYRDRWYAWLVPVVIAVAALGAWQVAPERFEDRNRLAYWEASLRAVGRSPLTGEGLDSFAETFALHRSADHAARYGLASSRITDKPHSVPLEWFQATGVIGGAGFLLVVGSGLAAADSARRRLSGPGMPVRRGILAGGAGMLGAYVGQAAVSIDVPPLWLAGVVAIGLLAAASRGAPERMATPPPPRRAWRQVALMATFALVVTGLWFSLLPIRADLAYDRADRGLAAGDAQRAGGAYQLAVRDNPWEAFYWATIGHLQATGALRRPEEAAPFITAATENYRRAADLEPGNPYHHVRAYQFHDGLAQIGIDPEPNRRLAEEWWQRAIAVDPRDPEVLIDGGVLRLHAGRPALALGRFDAALAIRPDSVPALTGLGEARARLGDGPGAEAAYRDALAIDPDNSQAQEGLRAAQAIPR